jgi:hypothetical protein
VPTKPVSTFTHATDALFLSGPAVGLDVRLPTPGAAQGYVPGNGIEAESINYNLGILGDWLTDWISQGSNAAGEDAHIVETDSAGRLRAAYAHIGGHTSSGPSLTLSPSNSGPSLSLTGPGGAQFGATMSQGGSGATLRATNTGTGYAVEALTTGGTNNSGVRGRGAGSGHGVVGESSATGHGVRGEGHASGGYGVYGLGGAAAASYGVYGLAGHAQAFAVKGESDAAATIGGGVHGLGRGAGYGVWAQSQEGGYALLVSGDLVAPASAPMNIAPQDAEPSGGGNAGDLYANGVDKQLHFHDDSVYRTIHQSPYGFVGAAEKDDTGGSTAGGPVSIVSPVQIAPYSNQNSRKVVVLGNVEVVDFNADDAYCTFDIYDVTAAAVVPGSTRTVRAKDIDAGANARGESVTVMGVYTLPSAASRQFALRVTAGSGTVTWDDGSLLVLGAFA